LFIAFIISLTSCKRDEEIIVSNHPCLKLSEGDISYQYDNRGRLIGKVDSYGNATSYQYVGDTILSIHPYYGIQHGFGALATSVIEKAFVDSRAFIVSNMVTIFYSNGTNESLERDTFIYNEEAYLIFSGKNDSGKKYVYDQGNLSEVWGFNNNKDSALLYKYEYDLLNENKEATWIEWTEHKGKSNKNLLRKEIDYTATPAWVTEYSYSLSQGYPIALAAHVIGSKSAYDYTYNVAWSCLK
jgi:YD repeat-containing protein